MSSIVWSTGAQQWIPSNPYHYLASSLEEVRQKANAHRLKEAAPVDKTPKQGEDLGGVLLFYSDWSGKADLVRWQWSTDLKEARIPEKVFWTQGRANKCKGPGGMFGRFQKSRNTRWRKVSKNQSMGGNLVPEAQGGQIKQDHERHSKYFSIASREVWRVLSQPKIWSNLPAVGRCRKARKI